MKTFKSFNLKTFTKSISSVLLIVSIIFSLVACSSSSTTSTTNNSNNTNKDSSKNITLKFQQWWGVELPSGVLQQICDGFTKKTGIKIQLLSNPYADTKTQIAASAATGTMADVVGLDGSWVYDFAKQGSIANMTSLMKSDGYDDSQLSSQVKMNGNTYMIPVVNFAYPMYVNLDLLKQAGVDKVPTTWSEFIAATKKVKASTGKAGWAIPLSTETPSGIQNQFMTWLWASGGSMLKGGKPALTNNPDLTATGEFVKKLFDAGVVAQGASAMGEPDMTQEFINGRVAFMVDSLAHLTTIKKGAPNLNMDVVPVPVKDGYSGKSGMDVANWGIGVAQNSQHKAEAMKFIEYLMSPEVNAQLAVDANAFPGNAKAKPDYSNMDKLFSKAYKIYQGDKPVNEFTGLPTSEDLMRSFDDQLQLYLNGKTSSINNMLATTQTSWEKAFK